MENLTINFCYYNFSDQEIKLANIDKLKLLLYLCEARLAEDIYLPLRHVTVIGTYYIIKEHEDLIISLKKIARRSRKIGLSFTILERDPEETNNFNPN